MRQSDGAATEERNHALGRVGLKLRERGLLWILKAAFRIAAARRSRLTNSFVGRVGWVVPAARFLLRSNGRSDRRVLAIHDFRTTPYTVGELLYFQEVALTLRHEHQADKIDVIWLCDPDNPARADQGMSPVNFHHYLSSLLPLAHVNPYLGSFMLMDSPKAVEDFVSQNLHRYEVFPPGREFLSRKQTYRDYFNRVVRFHDRYGFIPFLSCKQATLIWARSFLQRWAMPRLPVVVALRKRSDNIGRNADPDSWFDFFEYCGDRFDVRFVVIGTIEETDPRFRTLDNVIFSKDHGTTVEQDCALIQASLMYMGVSSGISTMAIMSDLPYIISNFQVIHEDLPNGSQLPFATPLQRVVWEPETTELLIEEFGSLLQRLDTAGWLIEFEGLSLKSASQLERAV